MSSFHKAICDVSDQLDRFFDSYYTSINLCGPQLDPDFYQKYPLMFACTHRSHVDYILVGYEVHKKGFKEMRFAAGDNLTRLPYIGSRFTSFGAFAVSRDTGFERTYVRKLCDSVISMMEKRQPIIVFPEGGRSYSGAMLELKNGILGAAVLSQAKDLSRDVYVVPIAVSYEMIPDLPYFELLLKGKQLKKKGNAIFKRLLGSLYYFGADFLAYLPLFLNSGKKKNFGNAYIDYKAPVSIRSIVDIEKNRITNARDEFSAHRVSMQQVSSYLQSEFLSLYRILPVHVVASLLKKGYNTEAAIKAAIGGLIDQLRAGKRNIEQISGLESGDIVKQGLGILVKQNAVTVNAEVVIRKRLIVDYYSATV
ncbi:MAG TPA: 1-acyl-sn-glycerol-3-phosphate acyltransferase [Chitinispirillaceae bacterium]|nr:1-acyl-sn-glycerol-3-phosphate acyltransferase [Chitinispirillaceae bacterium]